MGEIQKPCEVRYLDESRRAFDVVTKGRAVGMCVMGMVHYEAEQVFPELQDSAANADDESSRAAE